MCRVALDQALINCQGRTPEATMASALYTDVKRKLDSSVFTRYATNSIIVQALCGLHGQSLQSGQSCHAHHHKALLQQQLKEDFLGKGRLWDRPQEGLFGLKEWEEEGFVPDPVPMTAPVLAPQQGIQQGTRRLRGASTRVSWLLAQDLQ